MNTEKGKNSGINSSNAVVTFLASFLGIVLVACPGGITTGAPACDDCTITLSISASESSRTNTTRDLWRTPTVTDFEGTLVLPVNSEISEIATGQAEGRDFLVALMYPQTVTHEEVPGMYEDHVPEPGTTHYLIVNLGSSSGTGNKPHPHLDWTDNGDGDPIDPEEEEAAEEEFFGMDLVYTGGEVEVTIDGTSYAGILAVDGELLESVESGEGIRYAGDFDVPDGTYDITVIARAASISRLADASDKWVTDITFVFAGVDISTTGSDILGRPIRELDAGSSAEFIVLEDWPGLGSAVGHPLPDLHTAYMENAMGDSSQNLADGTNTLVAQISGNVARDLYDNKGILTAPNVADSDPLYFQLGLFDPNRILDHDDDNLFSLPNTEVEIEIVDALGNSITVHEDDLLPTYSHALGFHYGANLRLPPTEGGNNDEGGGGHGH